MEVDTTAATWCSVSSQWTPICKHRHHWITATVFRVLNPDNGLFTSAWIELCRVTAVCASSDKFCQKNCFMWDWIFCSKFNISPDRGLRTDKLTSQGKKQILIRAGPSSGENIEQWCRLGCFLLGGRYVWNFIDTYLRLMVREMAAPTFWWCSHSGGRVPHYNWICLVHSSSQLTQTCRWCLIT